jgi:hypothetical protein
MRRNPSRRMPSAESMPAEWSYASRTLSLALFVAFVMACVAGAIAAVVYQPFAVIPMAILVVLVVGMNLSDQRQRRTLEAERQGESLCTFVRSFDYRVIDAWILRAVYEELQSCFGSRTVPIRASDHLFRTLRIDHEDLDCLIKVIAYRSGRSLEPRPGPIPLQEILTVSDVVMYFMNSRRQVAKKPANDGDWPGDV